MNSIAKKSTVYIVAGPNGAGKTTFALRYLPAIVSCRDFLNADEIARGLSPLDAAAGLLAAGKIFLTQLEQKLQARKDFAFETTLSGKNYLAKIPQWQEDGWKVCMFYLYIPSPEFSAKRVHERVEQGGHDIPPEDIVRRYPRSIRNLFEYAEICDYVSCLDNSQTAPVAIFDKKAGEPVQIFDKSLFSKLQEFSSHD